VEWTVYVDLDAFYVGCEVRDRPELEGKPVLIGPDPSKGPSRGVVLSASYPARARGARSAMPVHRAAELVPDAIWIPPDFEKYERVAEELRTLLRGRYPVVLPLSIDEAAVVLDRTDGAEARREAEEIQGAVRAELRLSASIGVATHRTVAKIASDRAKPGGIVVVSPDGIAEFLAPLPVRAIPGVGPKTEARLVERGIRTISELAATPVAPLRRWLGRFADELVALAKGHPRAIPSEVGGPQLRSADRTFAGDVEDLAVLQEVLPEMSARLWAALQRERLKAASVGVVLRWSDFTRTHRSRTIPHALTGPEEVGRLADRLLRAAWSEEQRARGRPVRTLSVRVEHLRPAQGRQGRLDRY
jgi:DNA polymerase-4